MGNDLNLDLLEHARKRCEAKRRGDRYVKGIFFFISFLCVLVVLATLVYLVYAGVKPFFASYPDPDDPSRSGSLDPLFFLTGNTWSNGPFSYGVGWLIVNTMYLTLFAVLIASPIGVLTALFITRTAPKGIGGVLNSIVTVLAGIPSVIIGMFGMGFLLPIIHGLAQSFGIQDGIGGRSTLAGILVLALMALPTITSMSATAIRAVDKRLTLASLALGASKTQTNFKIVLSAAQSGIFASIILGMGRALGEATAIQMVVGASSGPTFDFFANTASLTTVMMTGLGEAQVGSLNYEARFSAALILMIILIAMNAALNAIRNAIYNRANGVVSKRKKKAQAAASRG